MQIAFKTILWSFYTLFLITPLFFWPDNSELFEFNKMRLVYGLTVIISTAWLVRMIQEKRFIFKQTILDIPIVLFFASQIISTVFSIDIHTSIWGYYSRSNGGLLSVISYIVLYYAFVSNITKDYIDRMIKFLVTGGVLVSLYAIPEHFGMSPSCLILTNEFNATCWVQDVQARVFATLGQPNWLAAYLAMVVFPAIYLFLTEKKQLLKYWHFISVVLIYMAFTFTYSRGGMLGFLAGLLIFAAGYLIIKNRHPRLDRGSAGNSQTDSRLRENDEKKKQKNLIVVISAFIVINLLFGSALTGSFRLLQQNAPAARPGIVTGGTQLENGGTESGQIRLIVWQGAIDIFKHYPLFGSGVETFAYSYYQFRPLAHNTVSEWDFLYNKAHNEYLNYLATTGAVGLLTYLFMIGIFSYTFVRFILKKHSEENTHQKLLYIALFAGYCSFLVQNIFGFSVVFIAVLFFLYPAFAFVFANQLQDPQKDLLKLLSSIKPAVRLIYKRTAYTKIAIIVVIIFGASYLMKVYSNWEADTYYKLGNDLTDSGYVGEGFNNFITAIDLHPTEPLYRAEIGFAAAASAVSRYENATESGDPEEASDSARIKQTAETQTELALAMSPKNTSIWRTAIRTYYQLSSIDPIYKDKTIEILDKTIALAPTDPKLVFNKGLILASQNKLPEAIETLKKAVELKPDYRDAIVTLADFYFKNNQKSEALGLIDELLEKSPEDEDLLQRKEQFSK
jgi:O-antigen ligase/tetratricopeptide (TPR) repeat protein